MNICEFIMRHEELSELPFLVVFRVIYVLNEMGMLKELRRENGVDKA